MGGENSTEKGHKKPQPSQQKSTGSVQTAPPLSGVQQPHNSNYPVGTVQPVSGVHPAPTTASNTNSGAAVLASPLTSQQHFQSPGSSPVMSNNSSVVGNTPTTFQHGGTDPLVFQHQTTLPNLPQALNALPVQGQDHGRQPPLRLTREAVAHTAYGWSRPPIGQGGFSSVFEGRFYNQDVAVKVLKIRNNDEKLMFDEELKSLINPNLFHKNIIPLLAYCDTNPAFVFPKMKPLGKDRLVRLPLDVRDFVCMDVAQGLAHMHQAGWVHSDMKPDNILLEFDANRQIVKACVGDMGCVKSVKILAPPFGTVTFLDPGLPMTGQPVLPHPSHDVFSLGVTFLCIFTSAIPEQREQIPMLMQQLNATDPQRAEVCRRMMHPDPTQRPSCQQLAQEFKSMMEQMNSFRGQTSAYFPRKQEFSAGSQQKQLHQQPHTGLSAPLTTTPGVNHSPVPQQQVYQQPPPQHYQQQPLQQQPGAPLQHYAQPPVLYQQGPPIQQPPQVAPQTQSGWSNGKNV